MNTDTFFGQSTTDTEWQRIKDKYPYNVNAPKPPTDQVNLDPQLKELKKMRSNSNDGPSPETWEAAMRDAKNIRKENEQFMGGHSFQKKTVDQTKHISYEGSVVLCVLLSMNEEAHTHVGNLPVSDYQTLRSVFPDEVALNSFSVRFDDNKDFIITTEKTLKEKVSVLFLNSVAHPRMEDLKIENNGEVPVERDGDKISVGGKLTFDKKGIKKLIGVEPLRKNTSNNPNIEQDDLLPKRQPVSGRNAYEIRADVLALSLEFAARKDIASQYTDPNYIIDLAKKFYSFVENKR